jgi:hypothetical protein
MMSREGYLPIFPVLKVPPMVDGYVYSDHNFVGASRVDATLVNEDDIEQRVGVKN